MFFLYFDSGKSEKLRIRREKSEEPTIALPIKPLPAVASQWRNNECDVKMVCRRAPRMSVTAHTPTETGFAETGHKWTYKSQYCRDLAIDFGITCEKSSRKWLITQIPTKLVNYTKLGDIPDYVLPLQITFADCN
ncbi:unnamed protein product [Caenorhabditis bovis]|uniref:Uncharacterized protein n=1 Tax=Caenorhabditis bovis TaxID=2654633 RepID=A0A8S1EZF3_9PELO|nr:unnamed protein product [Caenorhabditis bovis]